MITSMKKTLKHHDAITNWRLLIEDSISHEAFYVKDQTETRRLAKTQDITLSIDVKHDEFLGSASLKIPTATDPITFETMLSTMIESAKLVYNKPFNPMNAQPLKPQAEPPMTQEPFALLDEVIKRYNGHTTKQAVFNQLEAFYTTITTRLITSTGIDYEKTMAQFAIEAIPTFNGSNSVELYRYDTYKTLDETVIDQKARLALDDVKARYQATDVTLPNKLNVLLPHTELHQFFRSVIHDARFQSVYLGQASKAIGDMIQENPKYDKITLTLTPQSNADFFDHEGTVLKPISIIENGQLKAYYGGNQYASYLNETPTGLLRKVEVSAGSFAESALKSTPHLLIKALSGLQIEPYSDYIGGEIRLALYFDGEKTVPVSGLSFSGSLKHVLTHLKMSAQTVDEPKYKGPQMIELSHMHVF